MTSMAPAAAQYIPFAPKSRPQQTQRDFDDADELSLRVRLASIASSSTTSSTTFSQRTRSDGSTSSSSSTAYSSPPSSPTSSDSAFPSSLSHPPELSLDSEGSSSTSPPPLTQAELEKYAVIHEILRAHDLYSVLNLPKKCDTNALRRAYMKRCKACHPECVIPRCLVDGRVLTWFFSFLVSSHISFISVSNTLCTGSNATRNLSRRLST